MAGVDTEKNRMSNMFLAAPAAACGGGSDPFGNLPLKIADGTEILHYTILELEGQFFDAFFVPPAALRPSMQ